MQSTMSQKHDQLALRACLVMLWYVFDLHWPTRILNLLLWLRGTDCCKTILLKVGKLHYVGGVAYIMFLDGSHSLLFKTTHAQ